MRFGCGWNRGKGDEGAKGMLYGGTVGLISDGVLVSSMFEPCGLTQMIGLRWEGGGGW